MGSGVLVGVGESGVLVDGIAEGVPVLGWVSTAVIGELLEAASPLLPTTMAAIPTMTRKAVAHSKRTSLERPLRIARNL
jgi:hypothetical protein